MLGLRWVVMVVVVGVWGGQADGLALKCNESKPIRVVEPLEIEYPGGGRLYGDDERCSWRFVGYGPLRLEFSSMELEGDGRGGCRDYVYAAGKMDCDMFFAEFLADHEMELEFVSDGGGRGSGFRAVVENTCPVVAEDCDSWDGGDGVLVYTVHGHEGRDLDTGLEDHTGSLLNGNVSLDLFLFGGDRGKTPCYMCAIKKPVSDIPSCHAERSPECGWKAGPGVHYAADTLGRTFVVVGDGEFETGVVHADQVCIDIRYFFDGGSERGAGLTLWAVEEGTGDERLLESWVLNAAGVWTTRRFLGGPLGEAGHRLVLKFATEDDERLLVKKIYGCDAKVEYDRVPLIVAEEYEDRVYGLEGGRRRRRPSERCFNGGVEEEEGCVCRAGFGGARCEESCPEGRFGPGCEASCPGGSCRGVVFCERRSGCSCGPGYSGRYCGVGCERGLYGGGCLLECGLCAEGTPCHPVTGHCPASCTGGRVPPLCLRKYPHAKLPPTVQPSYLHALLAFRLGEDTVLEFAPVTRYKIQFRELLSDGEIVAAPSDSWNETEIRTVPENSSIAYNLTGLRADTEYEARVVLLVEGEDRGYDGPDVPSAYFSTKCSGYDPLDVVRTVAGHNYVYLEWEGRFSTKSSCRTEQVRVEMDDGAAVREMTVSIGHVNVTGLKPEREYTFRIKPLYAPDRDFTEARVATVAEDWGEVDFLEVSRVGATDVVLRWEAGAESQPGGTFSVWYGCVKIMASGDGDCAEDAGRLETGRTRARVGGLLPYRKYELRVSRMPGDGYSRVYATTSPALPEDRPVLVGPVRVWGEGLEARWELPAGCRLCNGPLKGYRYRLIYPDGNRRSGTSREANLLLDGLTHSTRYTLQVFIENEVGRNELYPLQVDIVTEPGL